MSAQPARLSETETLHLADQEFRFFQKAIEEMAGINMTASKRELVASRLRSHILSKGLSSYEAYRQYLESLPRQHADWQNFVNLLTTNKTEFFREDAHFEFLMNELVPAWTASRAGSELKVWCAASSTGEEPYTLSMVLKKCLPSQNYSIAATDIDTKVLQKAQGAVYPISKLPEIPAEFQKTVDRGTGDIKDWMRIKPEIKNKVRFSQYNLTSNHKAPGNDFDVIFCRNVLIYFAPRTIEVVMKNLYEAAKPGAYLMIGHSESIQNLETSWEMVRPSIYMKRGRD